MLDIALNAVRNSVLADLRRQVVSTTAGGFELLADEPFLTDLRSALEDPAWQPFRRFICRYIAGFAAFKFAWFYNGQGGLAWIFLDESKPVPTPRALLRIAVFRAIAVRFERLGVRRHFFNRKVRAARTTQITNQLLQRHLPLA